MECEALFFTEHCKFQLKYPNGGKIKALFKLYCLPIANGVARSLAAASLVDLDSLAPWVNTERIGSHVRKIVIQRVDGRIDRCHNAYQSRDPDPYDEHRENGSQQIGTNRIQGYLDIFNEIHELCLECA